MVQYFTFIIQYAMIKSSCEYVTQEEERDVDLGFSYKIGI